MKQIAGLCSLMALGLVAAGCSTPGGPGTAYTAEVQTHHAYCEDIAVGWCTTACMASDFSSCPTVPNDTALANCIAPCPGMGAECALSHSRLTDCDCVARCLEQAPIAVREAYADAALCYRAAAPACF